MPCQSYEPTQREIEAVRVEEFLNEIEGRPFDHEHLLKEPTRERLANLDANTARLCNWLRFQETLLVTLHGKTLSNLSLELQLWWRQHKDADARREAYEQEEQAREERDERALLAKLQKKYGA